MFPNSAKGGDTLTLSIEGFASVREAKAFVDAKCTIEVYEIDEPKRKTGVDPGDDLLAKFEATIVKEAGESPPRYSFKDLARTDAFPDTLPGPERNRKVTDDTGADWPLS